MQYVVTLFTPYGSVMYNVWEPGCNFELSNAESAEGNLSMKWMGDPDQVNNLPDISPQDLVCGSSFKVLVNAIEEQNSRGIILRGRARSSNASYRRFWTVDFMDVYVDPMQIQTWAAISVLQQFSYFTSAQILYRPPSDYMDQRPMWKINNKQWSNFRSKWSEELPLKTKQVESVSWMLAMERVERVELTLAPSVDVTDSIKLVPLENATRIFMHGADMVEGVRPRTRGFVLNNHTGTGKTATALALCCMDDPSDARVLTNLIQTKATLVVIPSNLVAQWKTQISTFVPSAKTMTVVDIRNLKKLTVRDILEVDFIITSFQFLKGQSYERRVAKFLGTKLGRSTVRGTKIYNPDILRIAFSMMGQSRPAQDHNFDEDRMPMCLENFHYRRIIIDEIHELLPMSDIHKFSFRLLTLQSDNLWGLTATRPTSKDQCDRIISLFLGTDSQKYASFHSAWFVKQLFCCIDDSNFTKYTEHLHLVRPTAVEMAIIQSSSSQTTAVQAATSLQGCEWNGVSDNVMTGTVNEIGRTLTNELTRKIRKAGQDLEALVSIRDALQDDTTVISIPRIDTRIVAARQSVAKLEEQKRFLEHTLADHGHAAECPVCLESVANGLYPCGHKICLSCAGRISEQRNKSCPVCRLAAPKVYHVVSQDSDYRGCKFDRLKQLLNQFRQSGDSCVLFVQWNHVMQSAYSFLKASVQGLQIFRLFGNVHSRANVLREFTQSEPGSVMILSLDTSSSGLDLTNANHVIFLHAIVSEGGLASKIESQAIGRVARLGQKKPVTIHHIIAEGTAEQSLFESRPRKLDDYEHDD